MNGRMESENRIKEKTERKLMDMPEYVYDWYMNLMASRKTAATCYDFVSKVHSFLEFINEDVASVKVSDITERKTTQYFLSIQTKQRNGKTEFTSDSYQCTIWSCLNNFFSYLHNHGLIRQNYIRSISKPKNHDLDRINENRSLLTESDFQKILRSVDEEKNASKRSRNMAIMMLFMTTGMRKMALSSIMLEDVDMEEETIVIIDKGTKRHKYNLNEATMSAINDWLKHRSAYAKGKGDRHLFLSTRGSMLGERTVSDIVEKYTRKSLGKKLSPHKLRSGYCSILYNKTGDIEFVRRAVGHSSSEITQRYIVTNGDEKKKASEIMASLL